jgi:hypothetical protein
MDAMTYIQIKMAGSESGKAMGGGKKLQTGR